MRYLAIGYLDDLLVVPTYHISYAFVGPIAAPTAVTGRLLLAMQFVGGLLLACGICVRPAAAAALLAFGYLELVDRTLFLNHYYLVSILLFLLLILPHPTVASGEQAQRAEIRSQLPRAVVFAFRLQISLVYFFAGTAKLNADWLLHAQPLRIWLSALADTIPLFETLAAEPVAYLASWAAACFDIALAFALWHRKSQGYAVAAGLGFHLITGYFFSIGMFPWFMASALLLFLPLQHARSFENLALRRLPTETRARQLRPILMLVLATHLAFQIFYPAYCQLRSRDAAWSYRGFDCTWRVMIAQKHGEMQLDLYDLQTGQREAVDLASWLKPWQQGAIAVDPDLVLQFARDLANEARQRGRNVAVFGEVWVTLNGHPSRRILRNDIDLARADAAQALIGFEN